jgi:site-specific DNA recombinase
MRGIIYARFSTERQSETSIADQVRVCRDYARAHGLAIAAEHSDEGISGAALGNRPGARAALASLTVGDVLIVCDLSRLSRSQDLPPLIARLRHRGVRVIGVQDGFDSRSPTARMQAGLSGIMSEEYRAMISSRTHSALEMRARRGEATGGKAYGDVVIVREIFGRFAAGETMKAIATDLNRRGIPSPGAGWRERSRPRGRWLVSALHALLRNEVYIGRRVWNRSQWVKDPDTGTRRRVERPEAEWIVLDVPPMIDRDTWGRVQARFRRSTSGAGGKPRYLLSGLLVCGECGGRLIVVGGGQHRYACATHHAGGPAACSNRLTVPRSIAEERLLAPVMLDLLSPEAIAEGVRQIRAAKIESERARDDGRELRELQRLVREGILSAEVAAPAMAEARRRTETVSQVWPTPAAWRAAVGRMREILAGPDVAAARECLRELIGDVRCIPAGDHVIAEMTARRVLLSTGTGPGRWDGSGGLLWTQIRLPISTRHA